MRPASRVTRRAEQRTAPPHAFLRDHDAHQHRDSRLELGGSALFSGRAAELVDAEALGSAENDPLLGLGGFELSLGRDVAVCFGLR